MRSLIFLGVAVVSVAVAGCGAGQPRARDLAARNQVIGGGCSSSASSSSSGQVTTTPMTCVVVFETGAQFNCPENVSAKTPTRATATRRCRQIASVRFPAAWRVVLHQMAGVRACLQRHGDHVTENVVTSGLPGASPNGVQSSNPRLVGELITGSPAPTFIGFTLRPPFNGAHTPKRWHLRRHGNVAVISPRPRLVSACAFRN
ncbi:MAG: hypothetical protein KGL15_03050 [Acidobacteriota bacterium]|nr:hypothetical protein [Acidobacteriota bacterium]